MDQHWTSTHIDIIWRSFCKLWDLLNGKIHCIDTSTRAEARRNKRHHECRALYLLRANMRHCDQDIFYPTVAKRMEVQPVWELQNWLKIQVPMAQHSVKEAAQILVRHVRTIISYFGISKDPTLLSLRLFPRGDSDSIKIDISAFVFVSKPGGPWVA
jgi:hypothetical protein